MNKEEDFLVKLCRAYLNGEQLTLADGVDIRRLYTLARAQNLAPVCHCALKRKSEFSQVDSFCSDFFDGVYISHRQSDCLEEIGALLSDNEIQYIVFKGAALKKLYPVPESRLMGDIDIIIREENRQRVKKLLCSNGFECAAANGPVYKYEKQGVLCEVHTAINGEYSNGCFENPFDYAVFSGFEGELENSYHLACLTAHSAHHFRFYGVGVKSVLDIAVLLKNTDADIDLAFDYLETVNLGKFGRIMLAVCRKWFGEGRDFEYNTDDVENFLVKGSAFGSDSTTAENLTRRDLEENKKISPIMSKIRLAFPSYSRLRKIDYIKFIDGRPWLTPYAWVYRFIYNFRNRKKAVTRAVNTLGSDETKLSAQRQLEFFEEIGLYGN